MSAVYTSGVSALSPNERGGYTGAFIRENSYIPGDMRTVATSHYNASAGVTGGNDY